MVPHIKNIALAASAICALTAITTSLRALGKSREMADKPLNKPSLARKNLLLHLMVSIIWFILSAAFAAPMYIGKWTGEKDIWLLAWLSPYLLLGIVLWFIWRRIPLSK